jgi:hypothetical protein
MPVAVSVQACIAWVMVGLCVGLGWAVAHWLMSKVLK